MKKIIKLDEEDLRDIVMERFDLDPEQITTVYTEKSRKCGNHEIMETVFFIEVEEK